MDINNKKYSRIKSFIEELYYEDRTWENIKNYPCEEDYSEEAIKFELRSIKRANGLKDENLTLEDWHKLVDNVKERFQTHEVIKLGAYVTNDASISNERLSCWQQYKEKLYNNGLSEKSIFNIERSSYEILKNLSMQTIESGPVKGLVVGNVQSGKTANMAGLISMASDNGFNFFIVLSGVIENLRQQTSDRLYNDLKTAGNSKFKWNVIKNPSIRNRSAEYDISKFDLGPDKYDRYLTVTLKNKSRLEQLIKWISQDINKAKQLKILVIDDEADQASVNTNKLEDENPTTINHLIKKLVNDKKFGGMNYISYTATPYANVLNETSSDSLYPKDFIILLEESEDYIGPKQIFGTEIPELNPPVEIIRRIPPRDVEIIKDIHDGNKSNIPTALKESINWFLISVASMRALKYKKPISMLVHTSFRVIHHEIIASIISNYLFEVRNNFDQYITKFKEQFDEEMKNFNRDIFIEGMKYYSSPEFVPEYPGWDIIVDQLRYLIIEQSNNNFVNFVQIDESGLPKYTKGIHLAIDNSRVKSNGDNVRLLYPTKKDEISVAPAFIVVGGNTLSRGLTIEGLVSTFFLRTTKQADTLMQMGRWFGYRKRYEIFPRVWLEDIAIERFQFLSQMNEELKNTIEEYATKGFLPNEVAPKIKNSPDYKLITITSKNKMQSVEDVEFDFTGYSAQTIYFENNRDVLLNNLNVTSEFLNGLERPEIVHNNRLLWREVCNDDVIKYLNHYKVFENDTKLSNLSNLVSWIDKNNDVLKNWNVVLSSVDKIVEQPLDENWNIHGMSPKAVTRTKFKYRSTDTVANIGVLRAPKDLIIDVENITNEQLNSVDTKKINSFRESKNLGDVPLLVIYKIDKGEQSYESKGKNSNNLRINLGFEEDAIGITILIPGFSHSKNVTKTIRGKLELQDFNEEEFIDVEN